MPQPIRHTPLGNYRTMTDRPRYEDRNRSYSRWRDDEPEQVQEAPAPFNPEGKKLLIFKGRYHDFATVVRHGRAGPNVLLELKELHKEWETFAVQNFVATNDDTKHSCIVMPYEGKMVVLVGHDKIRDALAKKSPCKTTLLSIQSAKKAYLGDVEPS